MEYQKVLKSILESTLLDIYAYYGWLEFFGYYKELQKAAEKTAMYIVSSSISEEDEEKSQDLSKNTWLFLKIFQC